MGATINQFESDYVRKQLPTLRVVQKKNILMKQMYRD